MAHQHHNRSVVEADGEEDDGKRPSLATLQGPSTGVLALVPNV